MFAMARGRLLFASAFAAIGALFAYLLVHYFLSDQSQRAVFVATIYIGSFVVIGALAKALLPNSLSDGNLRDIQNQAGSLVAVPMNILSGSATPLESMPRWLATIMQASPSTHFVSFAQAILYRGARLEVVWPQFLAVAGIGGLFLALSLLRYRSLLAS
jgi:ABC-type multidrug transport system permease subunit